MMEKNAIILDQDNRLQEMRLNISRSFDIGYNTATERPSKKPKLTAYKEALLSSTDSTHHRIDTPNRNPSTPAIDTQNRYSPISPPCELNDAKEKTPITPARETYYPFHLSNWPQWSGSNVFINSVSYQPFYQKTYAEGNKYYQVFETPNRLYNQGLMQTSSLRGNMLYPVWKDCGMNHEMNYSIPQSYSCDLRHKKWTTDEELKKRVENPQDLRLTDKSHNRRNEEDYEEDGNLVINENPKNNVTEFKSLNLVKKTKDSSALLSYRKPQHRRTGTLAQIENGNHYHQENNYQNIPSSNRVFYQDFNSSTEVCFSSHKQEALKSDKNINDVEKGSRETDKESSSIMQIKDNPSENENKNEDENEIIDVVSLSPKHEKEDDYYPKREFCKTIPNGNVKLDVYSAHSLKVNTNNIIMEPILLSPPLTPDFKDEVFTSTNEKFKMEYKTGKLNEYITPCKTKDIGCIIARDGHYAIPSQEFHQQRVTSIKGNEITFAKQRTLKNEVTNIRLVREESVSNNQIIRRLDDRIQNQYNYNVHKQLGITNFSDVKTMFDNHNDRMKAKDVRLTNENVQNCTCRCNNFTENKTNYPKTDSEKENKLHQNRINVEVMERRNYNYNNNCISSRENYCKNEIKSINLESKKFHDFFTEKSSRESIKKENEIP